MSLNNLPAGDKFRREVRTEWGGINLNESAGDGELIEALNMSSREFPLISNNALRLRSVAPASPRSAWLRWNETFVNVLKAGADSYKLVVEGVTFTDPSLHLTDANVDAVRYAATRNALYVFPAKQYHPAGTTELNDMEASWTSEGDSPKTVYFQDGEIYGVAAENNTIYCADVDWSDYFSVGDAVTISGCDWAPANNKTAIVREIAHNTFGGYLRFSENTFEDGWVWQYEASMSAGSYWFTLNGTDRSFTVPSGGLSAGILRYKDGDNYVIYKPTGSDTMYTIQLNNPTQTTGTQITLNQGLVTRGTVSLARTVPDMDFVCVNENRVWGCKGDTIYASKLGDPLNFNVFDGLSTDSWSVDTGTPGDFTGCCSFQGYPTFFKGNAVFRIMGDDPKNFYLRKSNIYGVDKGSDLSIVEIRGVLYYVSPVGVVAWNGADHPSEVSHALGTDSSELTDAIAGTDGYRYYVELTKRPYDITQDATVHLYVYDTRYGTWHEADHSTDGRTWFAWDGILFVMLRTWRENGTQKIASYDLAGPGRTLPPGMTQPMETWRVTFADSTRAYKTALTGSESKKGVLRLLIRCRLAGTMKVWLAYDGGDFEEAAAFGGEDGMEKGSRVVPLVLRRCDFWQLRLTGTGDAVIYSIAVERYAGEWQQA